MVASFSRPAALAGALAFLAAPALAQTQGPGWFVPNAGGGGAAQSRPAPVQQRPRQSPARPEAPAPAPATAQADEPQSPPVQLPPVPDLPPLPKGVAPPAAVVGVLGIPDIMRASSAAQQIEKVLGERREKLNEDAQKEQAAWRDLQQQVANQRAGLNAEQIRAKERELQERITNAQKQFRDRNRVIQEAGQYGLAQIERMLIAVIRQVAESRGMNLVLHRAQVALNVNEFDITEQVTEQLNKTMASVVLPPDGVAPSAFAPAQAQAAPGATPAAAQSGGDQSGGQSSGQGSPSEAGQGSPAPAKRK